MSAERVFLESSSLASVKYDAASETLEVEFQTGRAYQYLQVPRSVYEALLAAPSKGRFLVSEIRARFPFVPIQGYPPGPGADGRRTG